MPIDNELKIKLQVENKKANKSLKDTTGVIKDVERQAGSAGNSMDRMRVATAGLRRRIGALRNNLLLVTFALGGVGAAVGKAVKAYGEQELAEKKLQAALGRTSQALLDQASALQSVTTFGDENIIQAQALIAAFTDDEEAIKRATEATLDLAAAKGMDLFAAADLVAKTLGSSTNAMSRYGIEVTGAVGSTERLDTLTQNIAKTFGGQAAAQAETMTGAMRQAGNAAGDAAENLGKLLEPAIIRSASLFKGASEAVGGYLSRLRTLSDLELDQSLNLERLNEEYEKQKKLLKDLQTTDPFTMGLGAILPEDAINQAQARLDRISEAIQRVLFPTDIPSPLIPADFYVDVDEAFKAFTETQLLALENYTREQEFLERFIELYPEQAEGLELLTDKQKEDNKEKERKAKLDEKNKKLTEEAIKQQKQLNLSVMQTARSYAHAGRAAEDAMRDVVVAKTMEAVASYIADAFSKFGILGAVLAAGASAAVGSVMQQALDSIDIKAATGADFITSGPQMMLVGDNPSGQERVQVTPLGGDPNVHGPQGGGGSITVNIQGNLLTEEYVETELAEKISTAVRRGVDFGIS